MFLSTDNLFIARGRLARNPVTNISGNGNVVTTITIAQKIPFREGSEYKTVYVDYVAIDTKNNNIATRLAEFTTKGTLVTLEGYHDSYKKGNGEFVQINRITSFRNEEGKEVTEKRREESQ